jgi:hypothetical protein
MTFLIRYIDGFDTKINRPSRNSECGSTSLEANSSLFSKRGRFLGKHGTYILSDLEMVQAHRYVLFNCPEVIPYLK